MTAAFRTGVHRSVSGEGSVGASSSATIVPRGDLLFQPSRKWPFPVKEGPRFEGGAPAHSRETFWSVARSVKYRNARQISRDYRLNPPRITVKGRSGRVRWITVPVECRSQPEAVRSCAPARPSDFSYTSRAGPRRLAQVSEALAIRGRWCSGQAAPLRLSENRLSLLN